MKFSIIIACYNLGQLVCKAIESCIHQEGISLDDYEIIAINDGSTDNTLDYIQQYKKQSNLRIIDKPNGGLSNTRNVGLFEAKGEYVMFLDGDDWYSNDALCTLSQSCDGHDVIVFPMMYYYSEENCRTNLIGLSQGEYSRDEFLRKTLGESQFCIIPAQKKIYRKDFLLKNKIWFMDGILHEDNPFFLDVMNACDKVYFIEKPLYYYRQNRDGSITSNHSIRNFNGVMSGLNHIEKLPIESNCDVRFLTGNMLVFQVVKYNTKEDARKAYHELRSLKNKKRMIRCLFTETFHLKHTIRLILLLIDPSLLNFIFERLYEK